MQFLGMRQTTWNRALLFIGDIALIMLATQLSAWIRFEPGEPSYDIFKAHTGAATFTLLLYLTTFYVFNLYDVYRPASVREIALRITASVASAGILLAFLFYSLPHWEFGRGIFLMQMVFVWCFGSVWRNVLFRINPISSGKEKVLILGAGESGEALLQLLQLAHSPYEVVGFLDDDPQKMEQMIGALPVRGKTAQLKEIGKETGATTTFLAITRERSKALIKTILDARLAGMTIKDMPAVFEDITGTVPVEHIRDDWLVFTDGFNLITKPYVQKIKRLADFWISGMLLLLSLPIIVATILAIRIDSPGPIFFRQRRVGKGGKSFTAWKFRSMRQDAEKDGAQWATKEDPRTTRVGRVIRILRIDELPQIYNVFMGDMSLIGPRPERPEFVQQLEEEIPYYGIRHSVSPGITGWAQVNYHYGASVEDSLRKLEYDIYYIKNMSLLLDAKIVLKTIGVVLFGQGAR
jgi:sugar transferase (PEP-CTERM system associated)